MENKGSGYPNDFDQPPPPPYQENAYAPQFEPMQQNNPNMPPYQYPPPSMPPQNYPDTVIVMQPPNTQMQQNRILPVPPTNKSLAVFVTFCCCLPLGLLALKKSNEVEMLYSVGDHMGAMRASEDSKKYSNLGIVLGIFLTIGLAGYFVWRVTYSV